MARGPWRLSPSRTAIQPLIIGRNDAALRIMHGLQEQGLWVPAIRPPTVPTGTARLRITLSAAHSQGDVQRLLDALAQTAARLSGAGTGAETGAEAGAATIAGAVA